MEGLSFPRCLLIEVRQLFGTGSETRPEQRSDRQARIQNSSLRFNLLRHDSAESSKLASLASSLKQRKRLTRLWRSQMEKMLPEKYELSELSKELVRRTVKAEQESKEQKDDEQTDATKNEQNNQLWKSEGGPTLQARAQIFASTLFWVVMFFMASMWDREDNFRGGRGRRRDRNNRQ